MENKLPVYQIAFNPAEDMGVTAISLVDYPAIESNFLHFAKSEPAQMWRFANEEKREIVGAVLIPDKLIYRRNGDYEYFVTFPAEVVEALAWENFVRGCENNITIMHYHSDNNPYHDLTSGVETIGNWIECEDFRRSLDFGFADGEIKNGTWMMRLHITNEEVWEQIKADELRGFSVELYAGLEMVCNRINNTK